VTELARQAGWAARPRRPSRSRGGRDARRPPRSRGGRDARRLRMLPCARAGTRGQGRWRRRTMPAATEGDAGDRASTMRAGRDEWRTVRDSWRGCMACPSGDPGRPDSEAVAGGMEGRAGAAGRKDQRFRLRPRLALSANSLDHNRPRLKTKELFRLLFKFLRVRWRLLFPRGCPGLWLLCLLRRLPAFLSFVFFSGARSFLRSCLVKVRQEVRREVVEEVLGRCWRSSSSRRMRNGRV